MNTSILGNISLAIILIWGLYLGYNFYQYNKGIMKDRGHFNIQSKLSLKDKKIAKRFRLKIIVSFLVVSVLLIGISLMASFYNS